jgi:hypothetical protein
MHENRREMIVLSFFRAFHGSYNSKGVNPIYLLIKKIFLKCEIMYYEVVKTFVRLLILISS